MAKKSKIPKTETKTLDFLMWVGSIHYPTVDVYIDEAKKRGVCKRLGKFPRSLLEAFEKDATTKVRIFLAHDDGIVGEGFVFGYFTPSELQYICDDPDNIPYNLADYVVFVDETSIADEEPRECGDRREGCYCVVIPARAKDDFVVFEDPRPLEDFDPGRKHFRGMLQINYGQAVVDAKTEHTMIPPSRKAKKPVTGDFSKKEDLVVLKYMGKSKNLSNTAQRLAYKMGRTKNQIVYRFRKLTGAVGKSEEESEEGDQE